MATVTKKLSRKIEINAPVERVFAFLTNPLNLPEVWPSLVEVANVEHRTDGGHAFDFVYKMAGVRLHGHSATEKAERNKRVVTRNTGGIPGSFDWHYEPFGAGGTRLTLNVEYTIPGMVLSRLAEPLVHRINEHEADLLLQNLKARLELGRPTTEEARPAAHG
jgi:uncharacterized protein YndB with AHSA1/START domain